ncbi:serine hydrolase domain-containing protein [Streptomyces beijiangensis]|uniref:Beta-lactamase family protein n=1 Tax=Streptomyces beijiangensis TaxID=163361 RepID=A0A939FG77_9ACTN|nr:serine hydrolase domain-containing protein [Streptomyces beijiangensis]MBO0517586.1 beta-lactamase family protein [Streptomyces beijiangensis]
MTAPEIPAGLPDAATLVRSAVQDGVVPGAVLITGRGADGPARITAVGTTAAGPAGRPVTADTVFDLASLTKVVATTPAVLRLADSGMLRLDDPVRRHLPAFTGVGKDAVTIRHLLAHSSGLPPHRDFWQLPGGPPERLAAVLAEPLEHPVGTVVRYSDLGFILLGEIVAAVAGQPLESAVRELVLDPLDLASTRYLPPADWRPVTAATEAPPGGEPKCGVVHDENAESLGGVAGHAGLFGTAPDLARYVRAGWLSESSPISSGLRTEALSSQTKGLDGARGLGWTLPGDTWDHMSPYWPTTGAGHTGFTGTSLALDPVSGIWVVLLTNAVHYGRGARAKGLRRAVHEAVARAEADRD